MQSIRWGFTFLVGTSKLSPEEKIELLTEATLMYLAGEEHRDVRGETYEGVLSTDRQWKVVGGVSGQQFDARLDSSSDQSRIHLRFLVTERTAGHGPAYSPN